MPVEIFCCYARKDQELLQILKAHLMPLQRQGLITIWSDTDINAGEEWEEEIRQHLTTAQIILLLVSPDFMASDYCYSNEMQRAMERHSLGEAKVIPIILRPVYWQSAPIGKLQALPRDGIPVTDRSWHTLDDAFFNVVQGIREAVEGRLSGKIIPQNLYALATSGNPVFNDPLRDKSINKWLKVSTTEKDFECVFKGGTYHISIQVPGIAASYAQDINFSNFAFQAEMTILKGDGGGGLVFRRDRPDSFGYRFLFGLDYYDLVFGNRTLTANYTGLKAHVNQTYLLSVVALGSIISLYLDKQWLVSVADASASSGTIGFMAYEDTQPTEVMFSHAQVWTVEENISIW